MCMIYVIFSIQTCPNSKPIIATLRDIHHIANLNWKKSLITSVLKSSKGMDWIWWPHSSAKNHPIEISCFLPPPYDFFFQNLNFPSCFFSLLPYTPASTKHGNSEKFGPPWKRKKLIWLKETKQTTHHFQILWVNLRRWSSSQLSRGF